MPEELNQLFNQAVDSQVASTAPVIALNLLLAMLLGVTIAKVYKRVHHGISYSASYAYSIVVITMAVTFVMMVIGSNLARAFTLLGAFTLIRFRTAVKDPKDTAFIFVSLVAGLAVGATNYSMAVIGTLTVAAVALTLDAINFGSLIKLDQVLYLTIEAKTIQQADLEAVLRGLFKEISIINVNYNSSSKVLQYSYNVKLKNKQQQTEAMEKISSVEGVKNAEILSSQQVIEF